jgi:hypothetical protein
MNKETAKAILKHLIETNQGWCFYQNRLVTRQDCFNVLEMEADKTKLWAKSWKEVFN